MKKSISLIAIALAFSPVAAFAQNSSVTIQDSSNAASVVGVGNTVVQKNQQISIQNPYGIGSSATPSAQQSIQQSRNEAAVRGNFNLIQQDSKQTNIQNRINANGYLSPFLGHK